MVETAPTAAGSAAWWGYVDATNTTLGAYISGVGTDTSVTGMDAIAYLTGVSLTVCQQIEKGLGYTAYTTNPPVQITAPFLGKAEALVSIATGADNVLATAAGITGVAFNCVQNFTPNTYVYYHAVIEQ